MNISCTCGATLKVSDNSVGKKFRCPNCQAILNADPAPVVSREENGTGAQAKEPARGRDDDEDRPRKRRLDDEDLEEDRPRKGRTDEDDDEDRPRKRRKDREDDDENRPRKRRTDEEDEERSRKRSRTEDQDDAEEDDRPGKRSRRDDDQDVEEQERPARSGRKRPRRERESVSPWDESEMLKHNRFMAKMHIPLAGAKFTITDPDTKEKLGSARERLSWWKVCLYLVKSIRPWLSRVIEVKEDGEVLFSIRKLGSPFSFVSTVELRDDQDEMIGYFKTKLFSLLGGFWVYDARGKKIAEVQWKIKKARLQFVAPDGTVLGWITTEMSEAKGVKFVWGERGIIVTVAEEARENRNIKLLRVLLLATSMAMQLGGVAERMVRPF